MLGVANSVQGLRAARARSGEASTPPSANTPFVRAQRDGALSGAPGVVIGGYDEAFVDPRYHTMYDNASHVDTAAVTAAATFVARALYRLAARDSDSDGESDATAAAAAAADAVPAVNVTLVAELLECLTVNWRCGLMVRHAAAELDHIADAAGWSGSDGDDNDGGGLSVDDLDWGSTPPTYYSSIISSWSGLPLATRVSHGTVGAHARWESAAPAWDKARDHAYVLPSSPLELFARSFLSSRLNAPRIADDSSGGSSKASTTASYASGAPVYPCLRAADCADVAVPRDCVIAGVARDVPRECAGGGHADGGATSGACVCPSAFYHIALDPGLEAHMNQLDAFEVCVRVRVRV